MSAKIYKNKMAYRAAILADNMQITADAIERGEASTHQQKAVMRLWAALFECAPDTIAVMSIVKALEQAGYIIRENDASPDDYADSTRQEINSALPDGKPISTEHVLTALRSYKQGSKVSKWNAASTLIRQAGYVINPQTLRRQMARWKQLGITP